MNFPSFLYVCVYIYIFAVHICCTCLVTLPDFLCFMHNMFSIIVFFLISRRLDVILNGTGLIESLLLDSGFLVQTIQVGAARVLSKLFVVADYSQPYVFGNACFGLNDKEVCHFVQSFARTPFLTSEAQLDR